MKKKPALLLVLLAILLQARAQTKTSNLDHYFSSLAKQQQLNGNVLVAQKGKIIYENSFGYADFGSRRVNTTTSSFPIASVTKLFTATAILQLYQQSRLHVNDRVVKYLPTFPYPTTTINHLLTHSAGLPPYDDLFESVRQQHPDTVFTNNNILPTYAAQKKPLLYQPGERGNYDNINFIFLSIIIEKVAGLPYHDYVREFIFKPAGMSDTFFPTVTFYHYTPLEKKTLSLTYRFPHLYSDQLERTDTVPYVERYWHAYNFEGFGEIISTTHDLLKFDQALYAQTLLSQATLAEAFTAVPLTNGQSNPGRYGLGWQVKTNSQVGRVVSHEGGMIGLRAMFLRAITRQQTVIVIDNAQHNAAGIAQQALLILNGHPPQIAGQSLAKVIGKLLLAGKTGQARGIVDKLKKHRTTYSISEDEINTLGYDFVNSNMFSRALLTFHINIQLFPKSWNTYDSYAEALLKDGQVAEAVKMYRKSLELGSTNEEAKKVLDRLLKP